jgi:hypothetical protein
VNTPLPPEWDHWMMEGARLLAAPPLRRNDQARRGPEDPKFALGDWLLEIPSQFVDALAESLDRDPSQFRVYREVAEKISPANRLAASWTVHRDLRDRPELLTDGLTVRRAAERLGKKPIDAKPDSRLSVQERAAKVRAALADPDVYAIIEAEVAESRAERNARKLATRFVSEHGQRQRELEVELRALRAAMSPLEATVKAELRVNEAAQLVEAIALTVDDLHEPQRVVRALAELNVLITQFLFSRPSTTESDKLVVINDGEVW